MAVKSILHKKFEGTLVMISGLHGLGKTTLALTMENPALTGMIDFDLKGRAQAEALKLAWYKSPEGAGTPDDYDVSKLYAWFSKELTAMPDGITHLIIDNATWVEAGLGWRVLQNPKRYGVNEKNAQAGVYGGVNPGVTVLWANIFTYLQNRGVKVVTTINHMSQPWINGAPAPNKFNVKGNKVFNQIASLAMILTPSDVNRGGKALVPSALVIKEALATTEFNEETGEFTIIRPIPARIPVATWKQIRYYLDNPADFSKPKPGEEWSKAEVDSYSEWLSKEQIEWVMKVGSYSEGDEQAGGEQQAAKPQAESRTVRPAVPAQPIQQPRTQESATNGYTPSTMQELLELVNRRVQVPYDNVPHLFNAIRGEIPGGRWSVPGRNDKDGWRQAYDVAIKHAESKATKSEAQPIPAGEVAKAEQDEIPF